jgi:hypothetical protein
MESGEQMVRSGNSDLENRRGAMSDVRTTVAAIDAPGKSWIPLRLAPFRFQAVRRGLSSRLLSNAEIFSLARDCVADPENQLERIYFDEGLFVVSYLAAAPEGGDCKDFMDFAPYEVRSKFAIPDRDNPIEFDIVGMVESFWLEMEARFRLALMLRHCSLAARRGSMLADRFTEISFSDFSQFKVLDWQRGIAKSFHGELIFAIHAVPAIAIEDRMTADERNIATEFEDNPKRATAAKYFFENPEAAIGDAITKDLCIAAGSRLPGKPRSLSYEVVAAGLLLSRRLRELNPSTALLNHLGIMDIRKVTGAKPNAAAAGGQK